VQRPKYSNRRAAAIMSARYYDWTVGRLSPALPGSALLLLAAFGCNVMIGGFAYDGQHEATAKETPMKVTKKARLHEILKITALGILNTVADVAAALVAATSG
jgi:hypothetical protein